MSLSPARRSGRQQADWPSDLQRAKRPDRRRLAQGGRAGRRREEQLSNTPSCILVNLVVKQLFYHGVCIEVVDPAEERGELDSAVVFISTKRAKVARSSRGQYAIGDLLEQNDVEVDQKIEPAQQAKASHFCGSTEVKKRQNCGTLLRRRKRCRKRRLRRCFAWKPIQP
jgi:hypothetical protein